MKIIFQPKIIFVIVISYVCLIGFSFVHLMFFIKHPDKMIFSKIILYILPLIIFSILLICWYINNYGNEDFKLKKTDRSILLIVFVLTISYSFISDNVYKWEETFSRHRLGLPSMFEFECYTFLYFLKSFVPLFCAPIIEEIIYRGLIDKIVKTKYAVVPIIISSLVFTLGHVLESISLIYVFCTGLMLGSIYYKTGRLIFSILAHSLINFTVVVFYYKSYPLDEMFLVLIVFMFLFVFSTIRLWRYDKKTQIQ